VEERAGGKYKHKLNLCLYFTVLLCAQHVHRLRWLEGTAPKGIYLHDRMGRCLHCRSEPAGNKLSYLSRMELGLTFYRAGMFSGGK